MFPYILVGVGIGAVIHNWIPERWVEQVLGGSNPWGVLLATVVGIPMYADIFGTIPIAEALLAKGAQLGTGSELYDGGYHPVTSVYGDAAKSHQNRSC